MSKDPLTHSLIGHAMKAHRVLGPGLCEEFYHQEFSSLLTNAGIEHLSKPRRELLYKGHVADTFEADIVIENQLITELKALRGGFAPVHFTQLLNYSKFWRIHTGLLLDFSKASLIKQRVIYTSRTATFPRVTWPGFVTNRNLAEYIFKLACDCLRDIGLGYHETTWIGLMSAALKAEGLSFVSNPTVEIKSHGRASLRCLVIEDQCAVTITALGQDLSAADRATLQTYLRWLNLPWGIALHFGREKTDIRIVNHPTEKEVFPQIQGQPQIGEGKIGSEETKHHQHMNPKNLWLSLNLRGNPSKKEAASEWDGIRKRREVFPQIQERPQIEEGKIGSEETKHHQHMNPKNLWPSLNLRDIFCQERLWCFWKRKMVSVRLLKGLSKCGFPQIQGQPQIGEGKIGSQETNMNPKNLWPSLNLRDIFCQERLWCFWKLEKEAEGLLKGLSK